MHLVHGGLEEEEGFLFVGAGSVQGICEDEGGAADPTALRSRTYPSLILLATCSPCLARSLNTLIIPLAHTGIPEMRHPLILRPIRPHNLPKPPPQHPVSLLQKPEAEAQFFWKLLIVNYGLTLLPWRSSCTLPITAKTRTTHPIILTQNRLSSFERLH